MKIPHGHAAVKEERHLDYITVVKWEDEDAALRPESEDLPGDRGMHFLTDDGKVLIRKKTGSSGRTILKIQNSDFF